MAATKGYAVEDSIEMMCSTCDTEKPHAVTSVTKQGVITGAACTECSTESAFSRGVKTNVVAKGGKAAAPYDRLRKYKKGQAMTHAKFGRGEVTAVLDTNKIDVLFGDETRRLIHDQAV